MGINWKEKQLNDPVYIANFQNNQSVGIIDAKSNSALDVLIHHGSSFNSTHDFSYNIVWEIKLVD